MIADIPPSYWFGLAVALLAIGALVGKTKSLDDSRDHSSPARGAGPAA